MTIRSSRSAATGFIKDFQDFVIKGNIFDLAIAVIMGGAFGKVIDSLIKDVITPAILEPTIKASGAKDLESWVVGAAKLGLFISNIITFIVISFVIFLMVRAMAKFKRKEEKIEAADTKDCPYCLSVIPIAASKCSHCTSELPPTM
ncbi:large conductance mechanosensitive channel protein MscL [Chamaesiphon minutus]|uniref:Large-conductance mechanosensitive channel n=1 Tax=Chamaesiphon minutus (strain ATCC 27169 / PCC 6605) TaxID=1173020 RepID=K9UPA5_CHAP6|nr:large conductance mechanosensitive channel protein MscL [Chamaesiphon minutus]AFY96029.1 large conductance mechanosensitive channel protein [Chamaesiphon minutus PCC 6605]